MQAVTRYTMPDGATSLTVKTKLPKPRLTATQLKWTRKTRAKVRRDNPPSWVHDEPTWERAKAEVRPYWHNYSDPWAVVAHVYRNMGGR